jgi:Na+/proline symporter
MEASTLALIFLGIYLVGILWLGGSVAKRYVKSFDDFVRAGGMMGWIIIAGTVVPTWIGGGIGFGAAEAAYREGIVPALRWIIGIGVGIALSAYFVAPKVRILGIATIGDFFYGRYLPPKGKEESRGWQFLYKFNSFILTFTSFMGSIMWNSIHFAASGFALSIVIPQIPYQYLVIAVAMVTLIYTAWGGLWSVVWTDLIQGIIMTIVYIVILIYVFTTMPWAEATRAATAINPKAVAVTPDLLWLLLFGSIGFALSCMCDSNYITRGAASKSPEQAKKGFLVSEVEMIMALTPPILGIYALAYLPKGSFPTGATLAVVFIKFTPAWLAALGIVAVACVVMTTIDSNLQVAAAVGSKNLIRETFFPNMSEKTALLLGRLLVIIFSVQAVLAALWYKSPAILSTAVAYGTTIGLTTPVLLGLYWKKANLHGVLAGIITAIIIILLLILYKPLAPYRMYSSIMGVGIVLIVTWLFSIIFAKGYEGMESLYFGGKLFGPAKPANKS